MTICEGRIMGAAVMGKVLVKARIQNLNDLYEVSQGRLQPDQVRSIEVEDALVDTGATTLSMPLRLIEQLGLQKYRSRPVRTASGMAEFNVYGMVLLTVQDRDARVEVTELPEGSPVLIGQVPLELLDFVIDPKAQRLIGNPAHGGQQMMEIFSFFPPNWPNG